MGAFASDSEAGVNKQEQASEDVTKATQPENPQTDAQPETPETPEAKVEKSGEVQETEALKSVMAWLEKGGDKAEAPTKALESVADLLKGMCGAKVTKKEEEADVKKDAAPEEEPVVKMMADGTIKISAAVQKGKTFTSGRTDTLKDAISGLAGILKEVDEDGLNALIDKLKTSKGAMVDSAVRPVGTKKSVEGEETKEDTIAKALAPLVEEVKNVSKRLEDIEKARTPSKSVEGDGGTDGAIEVKKSMWEGVL